MCTGDYDIDNAVIQVSPVQSVAVVGSSVELTCTATLPLLSTSTCVDSGNCASIFWTHNQKFLSGPVGYQSIDGRLTIAQTIQVNSLTLDSSGSYVCQIEHKIKANSLVFILVVTG